MWAFLLCESCPRLKGINTSQDQVQVTNAGATVAVVSFGSLQVISFLAKAKKYIQGAQGWLKDTNCNLEMFLDQDRSLYRALGLPRSVSKVWKVNVMTFASKRFLCPKRRPPRCGACRQSTSTPEKSQVADLCQSLKRRKMTLFRWGETSH